MKFGLFSEHKIPHFCFFHLQCLANSKSSMATGRVALGRVAPGGQIGGQNLSKQLAVGPRDLAQAEKKITVIKPEQTHKMIIIFTQNGPKLSF